MYIYMDPHVTFWGIEQAKLGSAVWKKKNDMNVNAIFLRALRPRFQAAPSTFDCSKPEDLRVCVQ